MSKRKYDSTVARIAGNIIGHLLTRVNTYNSESYSFAPGDLDVKAAVAAARAIVAEVQRTEPVEEGMTP